MPPRQPGAHETPLHVLGATLRHYRKLRGLTQQALAATTGLHAMYISGIERGRRNVSVLTLLRLATALQLPVSTLLEPLETRPECSRSSDECPADN